MHTRKSSWTLFTGLSVLLACGCKSAEAESSSRAGEATLGERAAEPGDKDAAVADLDEDDREFFKDAAEGGLFEVQAGQLAQQKAENSAVREFGARMVADHGRANDELKRIGVRKGLNMPTELDDDQQSIMTHLREASGKEFDRAYMEHMVRDHEDDVQEFEDALKEVKDPELRGWAEKTLPVLREHLELARATQGKP